MEIYVVKKGDTLSSIAAAYRVPMGLLAVWNGLSAPYALTVGQAMLILYPAAIYTVRAGDTVYGIARRFGTTEREIYANNPNLFGGAVPLSVGQTLVLRFQNTRIGEARVNSYAYPYITERALLGNLPYLSSLAPFTYGFTPAGNLLPMEDDRLISAAERVDTMPLLHLSTLTENGAFSDRLASAIFADPAAQERLREDILFVMREKGYGALDIDFEFIPPAEAQAYADFIAFMRRGLNAAGYAVIAALAPKASRDQKGIGYEGHDYRLIGEAADAVFVMTYEWGYTYGPPLAVAPIASVRRVLDYAISEISPKKIYMGLPNYGYDWTLPYKPNETMARSIGNEEAVALAARFGAEIRYDETSASPYFFYYDGGTQHEVWFEDARSYMTKLRLIEEYGFAGVGIWNIMRPFTQGFLVLHNMYRILHE